MAAGTPEETLKILIGGTDNSGAEFAYAVFEEGAPKLYRIAKGQAANCLTLYIGLPDAFNMFQRIRLGDLDPYAPKAFKNIICAARRGPVTDGLSQAIHSMIDLFAAREEHDVGGWAVPYVLTTDGPHFCSYSYSVSDPVFDQLAPGSLIDHGTPQGGGSTLSVTEVGNRDGMVVYWLQLPGGTVILRTPTGYEQHPFRGGPSAFKAAVRAALSRDIELFAGDQPLGPPRRLTILRGQDGNLDATIADHGNGLTFAVHNMATPFRSKVEGAFGVERVSDLPAELVLTKVSNTTVELAVGGGAIKLSAQELDALLRKLGEMRAEVRPEVPYELEKATVVAQIDPAWRTYPCLHPTLAGLTLNLRHSGYGWLGFALPYNEAQNLGAWLHQNAGSASKATKGAQGASAGEENPRQQEPQGKDPA